MNWEVVADTILAFLFVLLLNIPVFLVAIVILELLGVLNIRERCRKEP